MSALALGVASASASPLRFIYERPDSSAMGTLPWLLVPGFLMPIYILTHLAIFVRLRHSYGADADRPRTPTPRSAQPGTRGPFVAHIDRIASAPDALDARPRRVQHRRP